MISSQPYDSQNVIYTQSQAHSQYTEPNLDEAFQDEFHEDDDPVYNTPQTILQNFLEYCSLSSEENDEVEVSEEGVSNDYTVDCETKCLLLILEGYYCHYARRQR